MSKVSLTMHAKERFNQRVHEYDNLNSMVKRAKKLGLKYTTANIPKALSDYLKSHKAIYYQRVIFCFGGLSYHQIRTCFKAPEKIIELAESFVQPKKENKNLVRTNLFCPGCHCYFTVLTTSNVIKTIYVGKPKIKANSKPSFADCVSRDVLKYLYTGRSLKNFSIDLDQYDDLSKALYKRVLEIPFGDTITYGEIAKEFSITPTKCSKILNACTMPLIIPTHRVISTRNRIGTYRYGIELKRRLLNMEV